MKIIEGTDLKKNHVITVLEWVGGRDQSYIGDLFNVRCVDLPFVILRRGRENRLFKRTLVLDTRKVVLGVPSNEHIKAVRPAVAQLETQI